MMLEQSLISPNFLGKESFRWFIGVITEHYQIQSAKVGGGYKVKVRIIGYHPEENSENGIKDEELPWAHVLVPLTMGTGTWGSAAYSPPSGGATVIGFFVDGDNGQQPVIIGGLFSGYTVDHPNTFNKGTNNFSPFIRNKDAANPNIRGLDGKVLNANGSAKIADPSGILTKISEQSATEGTVYQKGIAEVSQGAKAVENKGNVVNIPPECKSSKSTYSKIIQAIRTLIKTLVTIQQIQSGIINPAIDLVSNLPSLIDQTAVALSDLFSDYVRYIRDQVIDSIYLWLKDNVIDKLFGKDAKLLKQLATDKVVDSIWCAFRKIINGLVDFMKDFLTQLVNNVVSFPLCAAQAFVGSILSTLSNEISNAIGPALEEFSSTLGGVVGEISNYVSQALSYANATLQFLSCESVECFESLNYEMNKGFVKSETIEDIQSYLNYPGQAFLDGKAAAAEWLGITNGSGNSQYGELNCDATTLECGLPTIEFFGGGGSGAVGEAVIDSLGQFIGVDILNSGSGYSGAPYISITDACDTGGGAFATPVVENGKVTKVIVDSTGAGYIAPPIKPGQTSCTTNPITQSGKEVVGFIVGVEILKIGVGYKSTDLITDISCDSDVKIYPIVDDFGRIRETRIVNPGSAIRVFPELTINTEDGEGAVLKPILSFKPTESTVSEIDMNKVKKVILCAENHGQ